MVNERGKTHMPADGRDKVGFIIVININQLKYLLHTTIVIINIYMIA